MITRTKFAQDMPVVTDLMRRIQAPCDLTSYVPKLQELRESRLATARATPVTRSRAKAKPQSSINKAAKLLSNLSPEQLKALAKQLKEAS